MGVAHSIITSRTPELEAVGHHRKWVDLQPEHRKLLRVGDDVRRKNAASTKCFRISFVSTDHWLWNLACSQMEFDKRNEPAEGDDKGRTISDWGSYNISYVLKEGEEGGWEWSPDVQDWTDLIKRCGRVIVGSFCRFDTFFSTHDKTCCRVLRGGCRRSQTAENATLR